MEKRLFRKQGHCQTSGQDEASLEHQRLRNALLSIVRFIFFFPKVNLGQKKKTRQILPHASYGPGKDEFS